MSTFSGCSPSRSARTVPEKLQLALELEKDAIGRLNASIALCVAKGDNGSRDLLEEMLEDEEEHADWLETQLELIRQIGEADRHASGAGVAVRPA